MLEQQGLFVGLIPDGNRRWAIGQYGVAKKEDLTPAQLYEAYWRGTEAVKGVVRRAREESVGIFAAWGGSNDNLRKRSDRELQILYSIYERFMTELRDEWMDAEGYRDTRFVHMGHRERMQTYASQVLRIIDDVAEHTRTRTGMVVAVCLDYDSCDELRVVARQRWREAGLVGEEEEYLDLPYAGVPYQSLDYGIRTGEVTPEGEEGRVKHTNAFLLGYHNKETRWRYRKEFLPDYTPDMFSQDLGLYKRGEKREGE